MRHRRHRREPPRPHGLVELQRHARQQVPDGNYQVCYEMTESNSSDNNPPPRFHCLMFSKGPMGFELMPPDAPGFRARRLRFVP